MSYRKFLPGLAILLGSLWLTPWVGAESKPIPAEEFDKLFKKIKPQPGESRFQQIPWLLSVWEGRQKAAAEGKPLLVWSGGGGAPTGAC
jgi:hypothetical protein